MDEFFTQPGSRAALIAMAVPRQPYPHSRKVSTRRMSALATTRCLGRGHRGICGRANLEQCGHLATTID